MYDYIIIGGGFFGCMVAQTLPGKVMLLEKEHDLFLHASTNNQGRVHAGYHYPRHFPTAFSSYVNYARFRNEFHEAVSEDYTMIYPVAYSGHTNAKSYLSLYKKIGAPLETAPQDIKQLFNKKLIEDVFIGQEATFNPDILKRILLGRLSKVDILLNSEVIKIQRNVVCLKQTKIKAKRIILCVYSNTNELLLKSGLPVLPLRLEHTVMPLVSVPGSYKHMGITIMDGEFFSIFPYSKYRSHSIHHVRYTPLGGEYKTIYEDVVRYIPALKGMVHKGDICETKTILSGNDRDDGRPVLFRKNYCIDGLDIIVGAKLDNIYDLFNKMKSTEILNIT